MPLAAAPASTARRPWPSWNVYPGEAWNVDIAASAAGCPFKPSRFASCVFAGTPVVVHGESWLVAVVTPCWMA